MASILKHHLLRLSSAGFLDSLGRFELREAYVRLIYDCIEERDLSQGKRVHAHLVRSEFKDDLFLNNMLIKLYGECSHTHYAQLTFNGISYRNEYSWTILIAAYANNGCHRDALSTFWKMHLDGATADAVTFSRVLGTCAALGALAEGKTIHECIISSGIQTNLSVETALISMYGKCKKLIEARQVFENSHLCNPSSWNAILSVYAQNERGIEALGLFRRMGLEGIQPDYVTFISILDACSCVHDTTIIPKEAALIHTTILALGYERDVIVGSALVNMWGSYGKFDQAMEVFERMQYNRNQVTWNSIISGFTQIGHFKQVVKLWHLMQLDGVSPDNVTFVNLLTSCSGLKALVEGRMIHSCVIEAGFESEMSVGVSLVNMYGKCLQDVAGAKRAFDKMNQKNVVCWNVMISTYAQTGHSRDAVKLFRDMQLEGFVPDNFTMGRIFGACSATSALAREGKKIHKSILFLYDSESEMITSSLLQMYGKNGGMVEAREIFDSIRKDGGGNVVTWSTMIAAYAQHGYVAETLELYNEMSLDGVVPNAVTMVSVLFACSHGGMVEESCINWTKMVGDFGITPIVQHYGCMIDVLGRAGWLEVAENLIKKMPWKEEAIAIVWTSLLGACTVHGDLDRAARAAEKMLVLEPQNSGPYVLLSNMYASAKRWSDVARVRKLMNERGVKKAVGRSCIDVNGECYQFVSGDSGDFPRREEVCAEVQRMRKAMSEAGYVADSNVVLHDLEEEEKENVLSYHSEKLAAAFGIISTGAGVPLEIVKNIRVCTDCHTAIKFISKISNRLIVLRDNKRFHHFQDGSCSCCDYW